MAMSDNIDEMFYRREGAAGGSEAGGLSSHAMRPV
jgi:hypothetical protein